MLPCCGESLTQNTTGVLFFVLFFSILGSVQAGRSREKSWQAESWGKKRLQFVLEFDKTNGRLLP